MVLAIDGSAIEIATICVGIVAVFVRPARRRVRKKLPLFATRECVIDFLNGAALVPFLLLAGSMFSSELLQEVLKAKFSMGLAGGVGSLFILGEIFSSE